MHCQLDISPLTNKQIKLNKSRIKVLWFPREKVSSFQRILGFKKSSVEGLKILMNQDFEVSGNLSFWVLMCLRIKVLDFQGIEVLRL
jgi:hypothetical protein